MSLEALPLESNSETASSRSPPERMTGARGVTMPLPAAREVKYPVRHAVRNPVMIPSVSRPAAFSAASA
ncbi:Uncharacterised protein [Mycobacteroides abscessus subsp. massiliense]|nr:Uncharacterised protein [Mycobacteroides abscessus subsp. massiliense]